MAPPAAVALEDIHATLAAAAAAVCAHVSAKPVPGKEICGETETRGELTALAEALPEKPTQELPALLGMPWVREPVLNEGRTLNIDAPANHVALLAQSRGVAPPAACLHCQRG